jgi:hypothetical protein
VARKKKSVADIKINRAVVGFRIPMLSMPALYKALRAAVEVEASDDELKAVVASFPGVEVA